MTSTEHQESRIKRRRGSSIHRWRDPPVDANANGTGWANQLTSSLAQLSRSTRGCASTKVKRSKVGQRRNGRLDEHANQDQDQDEDQHRNEGPGRGYSDGGRRGFRHLIPELVHDDADCCSRHPPSIWGKEVASSLMGNGKAEARPRQAAIVEGARGRRWAQPRREVGSTGLTGAIVKMDFAARTEKEISWRGQKRAALATTTESTIPCSPKKQPPTTSQFSHSLAGSSACPEHTREQLSASSFLSLSPSPQKF